jgi:hypothetical protein
MSQSDLRKFVRFAWAQERLPADDAEFVRTNTRMLLKPLMTTMPDAAFPKADTCFFNVMLPMYSTQVSLHYLFLFLKILFLLLFPYSYFFSSCS